MGKSLRFTDISVNGKVSGRPNPEAWLRTMAHRLRVSVWRKPVNRIAAQRQYGQVEEASGLSLDDVAIVAALRRIPAEQRRSIVLHHLVGLSVEEIVRETGAPAGTVKARLARGRQAMAPFLDDDALAEIPSGAAGRNGPGCPSVAGPPQSEPVSIDQGVPRRD